MKKMKMFTVTAAVLILAQSVFALDGREIMQKVHDVKEPAFSHSLVKMDLIESDGTTESRVIEEFGRNKDDLTSAVIIFKSPAAVKNTRFLQVENAGRADDKWIYMPALKTTRRIAASDGGKSFMGTDATYDDMSTREVDEDTHELLGEISKNGFDCYQIQSTPKDAASSQYQYRISCIDKKTLLPVYTEMFDKKGKLIKVLTVEKIENISGYDMPISNFLQNVQTGHATRMVITKIEVDKPIPDRVFTANFLNTGK